MIKMKNRVGLLLAVLVALQCGAQAAAPSPSALTTVRSMQASVRPANVPLDYVVTPNGYFHPSCVKQLQEGEQVRPDGSVLRRDGSTQAVAACAYASFGLPSRSTAERRPTSVDAEYSGWLADSDTDPSVSPPANELDADWVVPDGPTSSAGQILYFFPGLESVPRTLTILQPVLAWNGYSNSSWTMANWNCCLNHTIYTGPPIAVSTGDKIAGQIIGTQTAPGVSAKQWQVVSTDVTTGQSTTMHTHAFGQVFDWYFGGVMEVYGVSACGHLPASGSVDFKNVEVFDLNGKPVTPVWSTSFNSTAPACNYVVNATAGETTISFSPTP